MLPKSLLGVGVRSGNLRLRRFNQVIEPTDEQEANHYVPESLASGNANAAPDAVGVHSSEDHIPEEERDRRKIDQSHCSANLE